MKSNHRLVANWPRLAIPAILLAASGGALAEPLSDYHGFVEAGVTGHTLTNNYPSWSGQYLRGVVHSDERNVWNAELVNQREWGDSGRLLTVGNTHVFSPLWSSTLSAASSDGGFFYPRYRVDGAINRKWGDRSQWVSTVGVGYYQAKDVHQDNSLFLGLAYYYPTPWMIEGGVRFVSSNPGNVTSNSQFIAVTTGKEKQQLLTLRYGFGGEAYQIVGPGAVISNFNSHELAFIWRKWVDRDWGFNLRVENYGNPNYQRSGFSLGLFKEF